MSLQKDYQNRIHKPISILLDDYDSIVNVAIQTTQYAEKFRKEALLYQKKNLQLLSQNEHLADNLEAVTNKYETAVAKHSIARGHFQKELKELSKFREQRDNFHEVIQLCKELLNSDDCTLLPGNEESTSGFEDQKITDSDTNSTVSGATANLNRTLKARLSQKQLKRLQNFNLEDLYDDDDMEEEYTRNNNKKVSIMKPHTTPRFGRPLAAINESGSVGNITFDSEPDMDSEEPDHHSTKMSQSNFLNDHSGMLPQMPSQARLNESRILADKIYGARNRQRYSSDAVMSTGSSSLAAGTDAGLYLAKKVTSKNCSKRRPSNQFRRRSQLPAVPETSSTENEQISGIEINQAGDQARYWPSDSSTPMAAPRSGLRPHTRSYTKLKKRSRDNLQNQNHPESITTQEDKENVPVTKKVRSQHNTPEMNRKPNNNNVKIQSPSKTVPVTPLQKRELSDIKKNLKRRHEWVHKTGIITGPKCAITQKKIGFNKPMWRCARCGMIVHPAAFDQANMTNCTATLTKAPSKANLKRQETQMKIEQEFISEFTTEQHNIMLIIEEIERRRAVVSEGLYRVSGNQKEKNILKEKMIDAGSSLSKKRRILASDCRDHNTLTSLLKTYLVEGDRPILTYKLLPRFIRIATDEMITASDRKKQITELVAQLPNTNLQVLSVILRHLNHVIENRNVNKMSDESVARSIGPSLIGFKTPNPDTKELKTAHHYQRAIALCLLSLPGTGNCVLGKALKKVQDRSNLALNKQNSSGNLMTPATLRRFFGQR